jgi:uncharacterized membrane protein YdfJ with MMPL/SSD domain
VVNMNGKECREVRLEIDNSDLAQPLSRSAATHTAVCTECAQFREERTRLRQMVGSLRPVSAPADFDMRLRARIAREKDTQRQPWIFRFVMSTPAIAFAALAVLMLTGAIVWINQRPAPPVANTASNGTTVKEVQPAPVNQTNPPSPLNESSPEQSQKELVAQDNRKRMTIPRNSNRTPALNPVPVADFNTRPAGSYQFTPDRKGEVSLTAPESPMVLTIRDEKGGSRRVTLPPVTFGSQRPTGNRLPVSMNNSRDW